MLKSLIKFSLIMMVTMIVTYFLAGLVARFVLGGSEFYPPSPTAISYLRDPAGPGMGLVIWPAQILRGLLFALVLFPLAGRFIELAPGLAVSFLPGSSLWWVMWQLPVG